MKKKKKLAVKIEHRKPKNKSGYIGVQKTNSKKNPFTASISVNGKTYYIGSFPTAKLASLAFRKQSKRVNH